MNSFFLFSLLGGTVPLVAFVLYCGAVVMLLKSMFTQQQHMREQNLVVAQLREHVADCLKSQIAAHDQVDNLQQRCAKLLARQQLVEKHGPDAQRIELATRMLKRGVGDSQTLIDLGLSSSEIKLLTQLHGIPKVAKPAFDHKSVRVTPIGPAQEPGPEPETVAAQGEALARLFEQRAATQ